MPGRRMRPSVWIVSVVLLFGASCGGQSGTPKPGASPSASSGPDPVIAAVGDIACNTYPWVKAPRCAYDQVARLVKGMGVDRFLVLGDVQYAHGSLKAFRKYYDRYFGPLKSITSPAPGNHETYTKFMAGYLAYFGKRAAPHGWWYPEHDGFYSFDLGGWHFISLNSQLCKGSTWSPQTGKRTPVVHSTAVNEGCGPGTPEYEWLAHDLALHPNGTYPCTVAYWHHPLYAWSPWKPDLGEATLQPMWELLDRGGVDVVLNGHYHNYQRWAPQDALGRPDPNGITEFIVGTGSDTYEDDFTRPRPANIRAAQGTSFGVLKMTLHPSSYDFQFVSAPGEQPYQDAGHATCR